MYEGILPNYFAETMRSGMPSLLEIIEEWILFNPDGDIKQFSMDTGIDEKAIQPYWARLNLLVHLRDGDRTFQGMADAWKEKTGGGTSGAFFAYINMGNRRSIIPITKDTFSTVEQSSIEREAKIREYIQTHPDATITKCANDLNLSDIQVRYY